MKLVQLILALAFVTGQAQETLQLKADQESPRATLQDISWIEGHWKGNAFGGTAEEIWSPPMGNSMMFVFRLVNDDKVSFYEIGHIVEKDQTLLLQLKHFDSGLRGWEEKDETVDFKLVKLENNKVFFEGLTMERTSDSSFKAYVLIANQGKSEEALFDYRRVD